MSANDSLNPSIPSVDIQGLHDSIKAGITAAFPSLEVDYYSRPGAGKIPPSVFLELENFDASEERQTGTQQLNVVLHFSALLILSYKRADALTIRIQVAQLSNLVEGNKWGRSDVQRGIFVTAHPEVFQYGHRMFADELTENEAWRVSWTHEAAIGTNIWEQAGTLPTELFVGRAQDPQPDHIAYDPIVP